LAGAAVLVGAPAVDRLRDNDRVNEPTVFPALIAIESIRAGMTGEEILRRGYVRLEIGGGRSADPIYLLGRPEYAYLRGKTVSDIAPGTVLGREYFRP
jgi:hypothetical protein